MIAAPTPEQRRRVHAAEERLDAAERRFERMAPEIDKGVRKLEAKLAAADEAVRWRPELDLAAAYDFDGQEPGWSFAGGAPAYVEGPAGRAVELDGERHVDVGNQGDFGYLDAFTLSAWIKPSGDSGAIIARTSAEKDGQDLGWGGYGLYLVQGKLQFNLIQRWLDDGLRVESAAALPLGEWRHVAVTYDGSRMAEGIEFFVNGAKVEKTVILDLMNQQTGVKQPLKIGMGGGLKRGFEGAIDGVRVYAAALDEPAMAMLAEPRSLNELARWSDALQAESVRDLLRMAYLTRSGPAKHRDAWAEAVRLRRERKALLDKPAHGDGDAGAARAARDVLLERGAYDVPGERVERLVPAAVGASRPTPGRPAGAWRAGSSPAKTR
jgi:hypothetical protein